MSRRAAAVLALSAAAVVLATPAPAWAHAALLHTNPSASATVNTSPPAVTLTYSEPVEARFSIVSVTDAGGRQQVSGPPAHPPGAPTELRVPVKQLREGWYLVFWRVISADGHPVRGAFTFAIGPNAGPAPQFVIPSLSETAATPSLLVARWVMFLSLLAAVGLLVMRLLVARSLPRQVRGASLRSLSWALALSIGIGLVATPVYLDMATAKFALRSAFDLANVVPLLRVTEFGRGLLALELSLTLLALTAWLAIKLDRPERRQRPVVALIALVAALGTALAALLTPSIAGHAAQTAPRGLVITLDWLHLASGGIWLGGLVGLLVLWRALPARSRVTGLGIVVPRFALVAFSSVSILIATGVGEALKYVPTLGSLWDTSYGRSLDVKLVLLAVALVFAAGNLVYALPRLMDAGARPDLGPAGAKMLWRLVGGQALVVVAAVFAAGVLTSLAPPAKALANLGTVDGRVGPGPVSRVVRKGKYDVKVDVSPNRAAVPNAFTVEVTRDGRPVTGADVTARFTMLDMDMSPLAYNLRELSPGVFTRSAPALVMVGRWGLGLNIRPQGGTPFDVLLVDHAGG